MTRGTAYLLLALGTFFWGVSFVVIKQGTAQLAPASFLAWRYLIAAAVLGLLCLPRLRNLSLASWRSGLALGLALYAGTMTQTIGLAGTSAANAGFIAGTALLFVPGFRYLLERHRLSARIAKACLLALAGLGVLTLRLPLSIGSGDLWVLASAAAYALHMVLAGPAVRRHDPLLLSLLQLIVCGTLCWLQAFGQMIGVGPSALLPPNGNVWAAIGFTGLLATAFPYAAQNLAQQKVEAHHVALIFLLEPVFASLAGHVVLHEQLSPRLFLGGGLILAALLLAELPPPRRFRAAQPDDLSGSPDSDALK